MGMSMAGQKGTPPWRTRITCLNALSALLIFLVTAFIIEELFAPPASSQNFSSPASHVVLCMGTIGARASLLPETLASLYNQTWKVDKIIVSLNKAEVESVLKILEAFGPFKKEEVESSRESGQRIVMSGNEGRLALQFLETSWGPGTKLVGAYLITGSKADTLLITVDDDCWYAPNLVETMVTHMPADKGALCGYCEVPLTWKRGTWLRMDLAHYYGQRYYPGHVAECQGWLMGFGGVGYWASTLDDRLLTFLSELPKGCYYHDDVWLSGYLHQSGHKRYFLYGMPLPRHGAYLANLSVHSQENTQIRDQLPCVEHFNYFRAIKGLT
ncbi:hypothetical protein CEUSTIGMA_g6538.t1 [Chlamydomonas eustigma]|uniref:Glycosyltransferase 2-like domain-containing protein n=1 Tax=Chlamydomonas eustigma TaxID=1157962 RepID=A0A250X7P0_9CHLO|nr:hypothetical protein CEUSTIGMA_g6538.t1 [Chlamydomonas eustigma]|eukprot:GAX79098.1 hypothetical protein CEUSTIGMA_g6538.t1 [Chlamydomonas eustigma]